MSERPFEDHDSGVVTETERKLKLPQLAMPLRVMLTGEPQSPSIDAVLELLGRDEALRRIDAQLEHFPR